MSEKYNFCPNCGHSLNSDANFCPNCGKNLGVQSSNQPSSETSNQGEGFSSKLFGNAKLFSKQAFSKASALTSKIKDSAKEKSEATRITAKITPKLLQQGEKERKVYSGRAGFGEKFVKKPVRIVLTNKTLKIYESKGVLGAIGNMGNKNKQQEPPKLLEQISVKDFSEISRIRELGGTGGMRYSITAAGKIYDFSITNNPALFVGAICSITNMDGCVLNVNLLKGESVLFAGNAAMEGRIFNTNGTLYITDKRLIFNKFSGFNSAVGEKGQRSLEADSEILQLDRADILSIREELKKLSCMYVISTSSEEYMISFNGLVPDSFLDFVPGAVGNKEVLSRNKKIKRGIKIAGAVASVAAGSLLIDDLDADDLDPDMVDLDGDGIDDALMVDTDGDGVFDTIEMDTDGDGVFDTVGMDTDGDGTFDAIGMDTDGDGALDTVGMDTDGDGALDSIAVDTDGNGSFDTVGMDTDGDGAIDTIGMDTDGDGTLDTIVVDEGGNEPLDTMGVDTDGDGVIDRVAMDTNGDGAFDTIGMDTNGDGAIDTLEIDSDGDGSFDTRAVDIDGDSTIDAVGVDTDGDGAIDTMAVDTDGDGSLDTVFVDDSAGVGGGDAIAVDTDGDGVTDTIGVDVDGDGTIDAIGVDTNGDGMVDTVGMDTTGDGQMDTLAVDTDGDGSFDVIGTDTDADGAIDTVQVDTDGDGSLDTTLVDLDGDGSVDAVGVDVDGDGSIDKVGFDSDGDGTIDTIRNVDDGSSAGQSEMGMVDDDNSRTIPIEPVVAGAAIAGASIIGQKNQQKQTNQASTPPSMSNDQPVTPPKSPRPSQSPQPSQLKSESPQPSPEEPAKKSKMGLIIGIVAGVLAIAAIVGFLVVKGKKDAVLKEQALMEQMTDPNTYPWLHGEWRNGVYGDILDVYSDSVKFVKNGLVFEEEEFDEYSDYVRPTTVDAIEDYMVNTEKAPYKLNYVDNTNDGVASVTMEFDRVVETYPEVKKERVVIGIDKDNQLLYYTDQNGKKVFLDKYSNNTFEEKWNSELLKAREQLAQDLANHKYDWIYGTWRSDMLDQVVIIDKDYVYYDESHNSKEPFNLHYELYKPYNDMFDYGVYLFIGNIPVDKDMKFLYFADEFSMMPYEKISGDVIGISEKTVSNGQEYTVKNISFMMKKVDGGTFQMGRNDTDSQWERPAHNVTVSSFYIGETEVTQGLWNAVMNNNPSRYKGNDLPVENVSYNDIVNEFLPKLNQLTGKNFCLPTEAEWEFAARGGNYSKGYQYAGSSNLDDVAWYWQNTGDTFIGGTDDNWDWNTISNNNGSTRNVKGKLPNELGIYGMSGNVWEWCSDEWHAYKSVSENNPKYYGNNGSSRVLRGGCWCSRTGDCRVTFRSGKKPDEHFPKWGFRLALTQ